MCNKQELVSIRVPWFIANWFLDIKLYSVKELNKLPYNSLSNILPEKGSKETER